MKKSFKILLTLLIILATVGGCTLYVCDYYPADGEAILSCLPEAVNTVGQGALLIGAIKLHKAGLKELKL